MDHSHAMLRSLSRPRCAAFKELKVKLSLVLYLAVRHRYRKASGSMPWDSMSDRMYELPMDLDIFTPSASRC